MKNLLIFCAALALVACGSTTPKRAPISGATLNVQLSEGGAVPGWSLGAASIDVRAFVDTGTGDVIASGSADTSGKGSVTLPGEAQGASDRADRPATDAVLWLAKVLNCGSTVVSSDAAARVLLTASGNFSTDQGGGTLFAERASSTALNVDMLSYATADATLSGSLTCGKDTFPVQVELKAGWNIVEAQVAKDTLTYLSLPLTTTVQLTRDDN